MIDTALGSVSPKVAAIRALTAAGYVLIPVNGKSPSLKNWTATKFGTYGEKELAGGNYGIALGPDDLVLDVDPRNFKPGVNSLAELVKVVGPLSATFVVKTGGGGLHIFLKKPAGFHVKGKLKDYPGIDIRTAGGQVVGAGSVHESGGVYAVAAGSPDHVMTAPDKLLALCKKDAPNLDTKAGTPNYQTDEGSRALFVSYLKTEAPTSGSYGVACKGRDLGLPPQMTLDLMVEHWGPRRVTPRTPDELKVRVAHAYTYAKGAVGNAHPAAAGFTPVEVPEKEPEIAWDTNENGKPRKTFVNLLTYMRLPGSGLHKIFGFNEFTGEIVLMNPAPWHKGRMPANKAVGDADLILLKKHLAIKHGFEMPVTTIIEAMTATAHDNKFHPVREYLDGLKWDGVERLDTFLVEFAGAPDTPYSRACARKMLCAAVMRIYRPGIKFDSVVVLEGGQGIGKSTICEILGGEWYGDFKIDPNSPDSVQLMQGHWFIEFAELEVTRRSEEDALKAFLSRRTDKARLAYGRLAAQFPRQSIFIATKNPDADGAYLKDTTGNRRWWPLALKPRGGMVDFAGLKAARNQLFAEAIVRAKQGEELHMDTAELKAEAKAVVSERHAEHPWTERVAGWIFESKRDATFLTARDIFIEALGGIDKQLDPRTARTIAGVMRTLGWSAGVKRIGNHVARGYHLDGAAPEKDLLDGLL